MNFSTDKLSECIYVFNINTKTMELMQEAMINMRKLSQNAQLIENSAKCDVDFLFDLNEHQYELQRHILCRKCYVSAIKSKCDNMFPFLFVKLIQSLMLWFTSGAVSIVEGRFYETFGGKTSGANLEWIKFTLIGIFPGNWVNHFTTEWTQLNNITRCKYQFIGCIIFCAINIILFITRDYVFVFSWVTIIQAVIRILLMTVVFPIAMEPMHSWSIRTPMGNFQIFSVCVSFFLYF